MAPKRLVQNASAGLLLLRQVAAPGSTGPFGRTLAPLLGKSVSGGFPGGKFPQQKVTPLRHSVHLLSVGWQAMLRLHRVAFRIKWPRRRLCVIAQRWWDYSEKCADPDTVGGGPESWWSAHAFGGDVGCLFGNRLLWNAQLIRPVRGIEYLVECSNQVRGTLLIEPLLDVHLAQHA